MHIRVEGIRWTRFWWYNPANGWPTGETDVLGGKYMYFLCQHHVCVAHSSSPHCSTLWSLQIKCFTLLWTSSWCTERAWYRNPCYRLC